VLLGGADAGEDALSAVVGSFCSLLRERLVYLFNLNWSL